MMKQFSVMSLQGGLVSDQPSILLPSAATSDVQDMYFAGGEARRYKKRSLLFADALPDPIIDQFVLDQASQSRKYYLYFTRRDIAYRDAVTNRFVFINKRIDEGAVSDVTTNTDGTHSVTIGMATGFSLSAVKAGDFIRIGEGTGMMYADAGWLEILSKDSPTELTVEGVLPTGYTVPTGGDDFVIRQTFSGEDTDLWTRVSFTGEATVETLIASNGGIDFPIRWIGGDNQLEDITDEFKCKVIIAYSGRVLAFNLSAGGDAFPVNQRWSELLDETVWSGTFATAGETALTEGSGAVNWAFVFRDYLYVVKSRGIIRIAPDATDIFYNKLLRNDLGTTAGHSFIVTRDTIYFFCTNDMTFRKFDGFYDIIISKNQDPTVKNIASQYASQIRGYFVSETRQVIFSVPYAGSETPNKLLMVDVDNSPSPWTVIDMACYSFGEYEIVQNYDWSTLPFTEWASWIWKSWRSGEGTAGTAFDTCTDADGYVYKMNDSRLDNGVEYESYIVFEADLASKGALPFFKRLLKIQFYTRDAGGGAIDISIKRDLETEWVSAGSVALGGGRDINVAVLPVDFRAKTFKIKVASKYDFQLIGMIFWFMPLGDR